MKPLVLLLLAIGIAVFLMCAVAGGLAEIAHAVRMGWGR